MIAHGIRLGKEIKVVGFDGQPARHRGEPLLTTVQVPFEAMAKMAVLMALERAAEPDAISRRLLLGCALRKGETG
jgi:DNA-binding LacI/PurR family transcriptional regulator